MSVGTSDSRRFLAPSAQPDDQPRRAMRFRKVWLLSFVAFVALGSIWSLAMPLFSGADEIEHVKKAQAVVTGQITPKFKSMPSQQMAGEIKVHTPRAQGYFCFIVTPSASAACDTTTLQGSWVYGTTLTYIADHPPLPYLLSGVPVTVDPSPLGLYLSRLLTAVLGAGFLATSLALALSRRRPILCLGILVAATPAVVAGLGVLSSSPLEIGSAGLLWTTVALLADGEPPTAKFVAVATTAAVVLALSRPVSFLWAGLACLSLLILLRPSEVRSLLRHRSVIVGASATLLGLVAAVAWYKLYAAQPDPAYLASLHISPPTGLLARFSAALTPMKSYWSESIGSVGYPDPVLVYARDYLGPWWVQLGWTAIVALVVGMGALFARARRVLTLGLLVTVLFGLPLVVQTIKLHQTWYFWQGRYDLPLITGIVILSAGTVDRIRARFPELARLVVAVAVLCGVLQMLEFAGGLRRYIVGTNGSLNPLDWANGWRPPIPALALLVLMAIALALTYGWLARQLRRSVPSIDGAGPSPTSRLRTRTATQEPLWS